MDVIETETLSVTGDRDLRIERRIRSLRGTIRVERLEFVPGWSFLLLGTPHTFSFDSDFFVHRRIHRWAAVFIKVPVALFAERYRVHRHRAFNSSSTMYFWCRVSNITYRETRGFTVQCLACRVSRSLNDPISSAFVMRKQIHYTAIKE